MTALWGVIVFTGNINVLVPYGFLYILWVFRSGSPFCVVQMRRCPTFK